MYNAYTLKAMQIFNEIQMIVAVLFGMAMQFFLGENKTAKVALGVIASSVFVAMYVVAPAIEFFGLEGDSKLAIALYAMSSLISMEIIAILILIMPKIFRQKVFKWLGVKDDGLK